MELGKLTSPKQQIHIRVTFDLKLWKKISTMVVSVFTKEMGKGKNVAFLRNFWASTIIVDFDK
jgi:hypothetical protein